MQKIRKVDKKMSNENEKLKNEKEEKFVWSNEEIFREELYILTKNHDLSDYEVLLKSNELNEEINKEMKKQINIESYVKAFADKEVIWIQSKNYIVVYKDYKMYTGLIVKSGNVVWIKCANKTFSTIKEAFNYLMVELEHSEENHLNDYF